MLKIWSFAKGKFIKIHAASLHRQTTRKRQKNMKKILLAAVILGLNFSANAITKEVVAKAKFKVTVDQQAKKANLVFLPSTNEKVVVKILNEEGKLIFSENIKSSSRFERPYNLSELADSQYTIVVEHANEVFNEEISLVSVNELKAVAFHASVKTLADGKVALKVLQDGLNTVFVSVKNEEGNALYTTSITNEGSFIQNFDISSIKEAVYFEVKNNKEVKTVRF